MLRQESPPLRVGRGPALLEGLGPSLLGESTEMGQGGGGTGGLTGAGRGLLHHTHLPSPSCPSGVSWTVLVHPRAPTLVLGLVQLVGVGAAMRRQEEP